MNRISDDVCARFQAVVAEQLPLVRSERGLAEGQCCEMISGVRWHAWPPGGRSNSATSSPSKAVCFTGACQPQARERRRRVHLLLIPSWQRAAWSTDC